MADIYPETIKFYYKIIEANEDDQSITVRYWTDFLSEEELAADNNRNPDGTPVRCRTDYNFNIWDNTKTTEEIEKMIVSSFPREWFLLKYAVKTPNIDHTTTGRMKGVSSLLNKTHERESQKPEINNEPILAQDNINEFIENAPRFSENELDAILEKFLKTKTI
jgi:hypothetical protein